MKAEGVFTFLLLCVMASQAQKKDCDDFVFDHLVFFVSDTNMEQQFNRLFTLGEKLTTQHYHQGTYSHFYLFYNTFIELLYIDDSIRIKSNSAALGSKYLERWKSKAHINRLGFGLILNDFDTTCADLHPYYSKDNKGHYLMSKANAKEEDVFIYASEATQQYKDITKLEDLKQHFKPPYLADFMQYNQHSSGITTLTKIRIALPDANQKENIEEISKFNLVSIEDAKTFRCILEFDTLRQGKSLFVSEWLEVKY